MLTYSACNQWRNVLCSTESGQHRLVKELLAFGGSRIAVRFAYERLDAERDQ